MKFQFNDAGRIGNDKKDCVVRAISIATETPYCNVLESMKGIASNERSGTRKMGKSFTGHGVYRYTYDRFMKSIGWKWFPTMGIGTGCKVHLRDGELPMGRLVVSVSRHLTAVIDGVIHDTGDCSRNGTRCVYGYWMKEVV